jgi:hypothetical protein
MERSVSAEGPDAIKSSGGSRSSLDHLVAGGGVGQARVRLSRVEEVKTIAE